MKNLKLVLTLLACVFGSISGFEAWASRTVYYVNEVGWTTRKAYVWNKTTKVEREGWTGKELTLSKYTYGGKPVYYQTIDDQYDMVVFNNGESDNEKNKKTADLDIHDGSLYIVTAENIEGSDNKKKTNELLSGKYKFDETTEYTAYIINSNTSWMTYAHIWEKDVDGYRTTWPGNSMTLTDTGKTIDGKTVYAYTFSVGFAPKNIIFHDYKDGGYKTADLGFADKNLYIFSSGASCTTKAAGTYEFDGEGLPTTLTLVMDGIDPVSATKAADDTYTFSVTPAANASFYITDGNATYRPAGGTDYTILTNGSFDTKKNPSGSAQFLIKKGYSYVFKASFINGTVRLAATVEQLPVTDYPELAIRGTFTGTDWAWNTDYVGTREGGVYTWTFPNGIENTIGTNEFKIASQDWTLAYTTKNKKMVRNNKYDVTDNKDAGNMALSEIIRVAVTIKFDFDNKTLEFIADEAVTPELPRRIYMSFGQQRIYDGNRDKAPSVKLLNNRHSADYGITLTQADFNDANFKMKKLYPAEDDSPLWYFDLTEEQFRNTKDIVFFFEPKNFDASQNNYYQYIAGRATNWDTDNYTKYIYFADNGKAAQSYMTISQYEQVRGKAKEKLYITGTGFQGLHNWGIIPDGINSANSIDEIGATSGTLVVEAVNGVFYQTIRPDEANFNSSTPSDGTGPDNSQKGAAFKMSWIRPAEWYLASGKSGGEMDTQRAWATFNLGIVGFKRMHPAVLSGQIPYIVGTANTANAEVYCSPARTLPLNNYNQADWFIRSQYMSNESSLTEYTLVIDLDADCQTVTLLPFAPNPTIDDVTVSATVVDLSNEQAETVHDRLEGTPIAAEAVSGKVLFNKVNKATATVTIKAPNSNKYEGSYKLVNGNDMSYKFDVEYAIYSDDVPVGVYKGVPGKILIDGIAVGKDAVLSIRAKYTDATSYDGKEPSGLTFHSKEADGTMTFDELPAIPAANVGAKNFTSGSNFLNDPDRDNHRYTLGAYAGVEVEAPETDYQWYADFQLVTKGDSHHNAHPFHANGGEVVHAAHAAAAENGNPALTGFNPWTDGDYSDANNWSAMMGKGGVTTWPLHLPEVVEVKRTYSTENDWEFTENEPKAEIEGYVKAVYPFLIDTNSTITIAPAENAAKAAPMRISKAGGYAGEPNYVVSLQHSAEAPFSFALGSGDLTGVTDVLAPEATTGEVEYYNLQGVRMGGELTPGVYIRRQGNKVEKIIIR